MKYFFTFLLIGYSIFGLSQSGCYNSVISPEINDEPPGCVLCNGTQLEFVNEGFTPDSFNNPLTIFDIDNSAWFSFHTNENGFLSLNGFAGNCQKELGLEISVFDESLNKIFFEEFFFPEQFRQVQLDLLAPNTLYYLMVDGVSGDICNLELEIEMGSSPLAPTFNVFPKDNIYCLGSEICYEVTDPQVEFQYDWILPIGDSLISGGTEKDSKTCIRFLEAGDKEVSVSVISPCQPPMEFSELFVIVNIGQSLQIDTIFSDEAEICLNQEKEYFIKWNGPPIGFKWLVSPELRKTAGGGFQDTFMRVRFDQSGLGAISVDPNDLCGLRYYEDLPIPAPRTSSIFQEICEDDCIQVGDTCVSNEGAHTITIPLPEKRCDSTVVVRVTYVDILPSPSIACSAHNDGLLVEWNSAADSFKVTIDRVKDTILYASELLLENLTVDDIVAIKVQPLGSCVYLPAEIVCSGTTSSSVQISDATLDEILVYPNPTMGEVYLKTDLQIDYIEVFDLAGKLMSIEKEPNFSIPAKGIFILKINTSNGLVIKRVFVN